MKLSERLADEEHGAPGWVLDAARELEAQVEAQVERTNRAIEVWQREAQSAMADAEQARARAAAAEDERNQYAAREAELEAERDALAGQVAALRDALEKLANTPVHANLHDYREVATEVHSVLADTAAAARGWRGPEVVRALVEALRKARGVVSYAEHHAPVSEEHWRDIHESSKLIEAAIAAAEKGE